MIIKNSPGYSTEPHPYFPPHDRRPKPPRASGQKRIRIPTEREYFVKEFKDVRTGRTTVLVGS